MKHNAILKPMNEVLQRYDEIYEELMIWRKRYCTSQRMDDSQTYRFCELQTEEIAEKGPEFWAEVIKKS